MKKYLFLLLFCAFPVFAKQLSLLEEAGQLGTVAGLAEACGSKEKLKRYEFISARLIANKASSENEEMQGYQRYAEKKLQAKKMHQQSPKMTCGEIIKRFEKMPVLKSVVYKSGALKFYDGTYYPAKGIYTKKNNET